MSAVVNSPKPASGVTWALVQHPNKFICSGLTSGNLSCSVTVTSTTAGNLLVMLSSSFEGTTVASTVQTYPNGN
jgi:hypothetical protein